MKKTHNIFFIQKANGKGKSLFTVGGQKLTCRTDLKDDCMTHGCETLRKKYPLDTVFVAESDKVRERNGCYMVTVLFPLLLPDGTPASDDIFLQEAITQYQQLIH